MKAHARWLFALSILCLGADSAIPSNRGSDLPVRCSMITLIAHPERYSGRRIETEGVLAYELEHHALYPTREYAADRMMLSGIYLNFRNSEVPEEARRAAHMKRVMITGTYEGFSELDGEWRGTISNITEIRWRREIPH